jgi:phosphoadenosine phosphosulfate reductase
MNVERIERLNEAFKKQTSERVLHYFLGEFKGRIVLSSSLGAEDQVLTYMICQIDKGTRIFTLDTNRLFPETYELINHTNKAYGINIEIFSPDQRQVEEMVSKKGINLFYESVENRMECCRIRKIEPLKQALKGMEVWICGLRKDQSITRFNSKLLEWDETYNLLTLNPLINWTDQQVWSYIKEHNIPYNPLHDKGFPSIGCEPCTRAILPGEEIRAGRWWWEQPEQRECGLH